MSDDPEIIRLQIARTRESLSAHVNALGDAVAPGNVARRQVRKVTGAVDGAKERVMGVNDDVRSTAGSMGNGAGNALASAGGALQDAPHEARARTQGNPLAAGLVALGAGLLLGSLLPSTARERSTARDAKDRAQPLMDEGRQIAQDAGEHLRQPAMDAAQAVKDHAQDAAQSVRAQGQAEVDDVRATAQDAADAVNGSRKA